MTDPLSLFDISYLAAFLGGVLTLLPSCGPFLLPAFFAISFKEKKHLVRATFLFFFGLLITFIPLGLGITALVQQVTKNLALIKFVSGIILIFFAVITFFGKNTNLPLSHKLKNKISKKLHRSDTPKNTDALSILVFGMIFGVASGACTAPLFGAVLTVAVTLGVSLKSVLLLFMFALGMIVPLLLIAWFFDSISEKTKMKFFRIKVLKKPLTTVLASLLFASLGLLFLLGNFHTLFASDSLTNLAITLSDNIRTLADATPSYIQIPFFALLAVLLARLLMRWKK